MDTTVEDLRRLLSALPQYNGSDWFERLEDRKREEAVFHDEDRDAHKDEAIESTPNRRFYAAAAPVAAHIDEWYAREIPGRVFLDYACGNGSSTIRAARLGASLAVGIDISKISIANAIENSAYAGTVGQTLFLQRDCEATELPDSAFDRILCSGMLHHLDLNRAFPELRRIAKPGARILCQEALGHNPFIQLYRELTPKYRTTWEKDHILRVRDLRLAKRWFRVENVRFFCFTSPLAGLVPRKIHPLVLPGLHAIDWMLTRTPGLRLWSWQFSFELVVAQ